MANWIENNATRSIIVYTVLIIGATWATLSLLLDERKENLHNTEIALKQTEIDNKILSIDQLKARVELLESEKAELKIQNQRYYEIIYQNPKSLEYLENQIKKLEINNRALQAELDFSKSNQQNMDNSEPYVYSSGFLDVGEAFVDPLTGVSIGLSNIDLNRRVTGTITKPGSTSENFHSIQAGYAWPIEKAGKQYKLILTKVDYVTQRFTVEIREKLD